MLKRAYMVLATLWAVVLFLLLLINATPENGNLGPGMMLIAFGPLAVPVLLRLFFGYVIFGGRPR